MLAEALYELAMYVDIKAGFYDIHTDLDAQLMALIRRQVVLAERQQAARDLGACAATAAAPTWCWCRCITLCWTCMN